MIFLLYHERELRRPSNTGQLIRKVLGNAVCTIMWQRKAPDPRLIQAIADKKVALVYPHKQESVGMLEHNCQSYDHFVIVDGTWQEANKIINQSDYLQTLPRIQFPVNNQSVFNLRRNQKPNGLCTAEIGIQLLHALDNPKVAAKLHTELLHFIAMGNAKK